MADASLQRRVERLEENLPEWEAITKIRGANFNLLASRGRSGWRSKQTARKKRHLLGPQIVGATGWSRLGDDGRLGPQEALSPQWSCVSASVLERVSREDAGA